MWIPFGKPAAVARISGNDRAPCLHGTVKFHPMGADVMVVADIYGLPKTDAGRFAMSICRARSCKEALSLTDRPADPEQQSTPGALPPLVSCGGRGFLAVLTGQCLVPDVMGRTLVLRADPGSGGEPGERIACGVIVPC